MFDTSTFQRVVFGHPFTAKGVYINRILGGSWYNHGFSGCALLVPAIHLVFSRLRGTVKKAFTNESLVENTTIECFLKGGGHLAQWVDWCIFLLPDGLWEVIDFLSRPSLGS